MSEKYYLLSARNGKDHFVKERIDWYSQFTLCGKETRGVCSEYNYDDRAVTCKRCMTKAGFIKKLRSANSPSSPGVIGYNQTIYTVLKRFVIGLEIFDVGDEIDGERYDHSR